MKIKSQAATIAALAAVCAFAVMNARRGFAAAAGLTPESMAGSYSFRLHGATRGDAICLPVGGQNHCVVSYDLIALTGVITADGWGNITGGSISYNEYGNRCEGTIRSGSYHVNPDGEGDVTLYFPDVKPLNRGSGFGGGESCYLSQLTLSTALADVRGHTARIVQLASIDAVNVGVSDPEMILSGVAVRQSEGGITAPAGGPGPTAP